MFCILVLYIIDVFIFLFIYFYTGPILIAVFITEMVILFKHIIIIIIIIIIPVSDYRLPSGNFSCPSSIFILF